MRFYLNFFIMAFPDLIRLSFSCSFAVFADAFVLFLFSCAREGEREREREREKRQPAMNLCRGCAVGARPLNSPPPPSNVLSRRVCMCIGELCAVSAGDSARRSSGRGREVSLVRTANAICWEMTKACSKTRERARIRFCAKWMRTSYKSIIL